jgi:hypothetical protein
MGKNAQPPHSVKNCYNRRAHGHERPRKLTEYYLCYDVVLMIKISLIYDHVVKLGLKHNSLLFNAKTVTH